jgi:glutaredoxin
MSKITVYSTATCGYCKMLKNYLQSKDIAYEEKKADKDQKVAQELYEKSGQMGVPYTVITNDQGEETGIVGFNRIAIDTALKS